MAIKPFAIQGADLTLGGVSLQAGTAGVVIPGVTQATNYTVEEIDETGEQSYSFNSRPFLIDAYTYLILDGAQADPGNLWTRPEYLVDGIDDEGYIDGIGIVNAGSILPATVDNGLYNATYMWASDVSTALDQGSWNASDWQQVPFRPIVRADDVESISGIGGGVVVRSVNFPEGEEGDTRGTIADVGQGTLYYCTEDWSEPDTFEVETAEPYAAGQTGGDVVFVIPQSAYPELADLVDINNPGLWSVTGELELAGEGTWPVTQITVNTADVGEFTGENVWWFNVGNLGLDYPTENEQIPAGSAFQLNYSVPIWEQVSTGTSDSVTFDEDGAINLTDHGVIRNQVDSEDVNIVANGFVQLQWTTPEGVAEANPNNTQELVNWLFVESDGIHIETNVNGDGGSNDWLFNDTGGLEFPDGTTQTTAYIGDQLETKLWIAAGNSPGGAALLHSSTGLAWTTEDYMMNGTNIKRVAISTDKIVYLMSLDGLGNAIYYTDAPEDVPTLATGTDSYGEGATVYWNEVNYLGGKFVAVGYYQTTGATVSTNVNGLALAGGGRTYPRIALSNLNYNYSGTSITITGATNTELNGTFILQYNSEDTIQSGVYDLTLDGGGVPTITSVDVTGATVADLTGVDGTGPLFAYSTDGVTWTYGDLDPAYLADFGPIAELEMSDVAYDGTGYLIPVIDDMFINGENDQPTLQGPGAFYITDITGPVGQSEFISGTDEPGGLPGIFNNIAAYADGTFFISDDNYTVWTGNINDGWISHDIRTDMQTAYGWTPEGDNPNNDVDSAVAGTVNGTEYWIATTNAGMVVRTSDQGATFQFSIPEPITVTATLHDVGPVLIDFTGQTLPIQWEKITITVAEGDDTSWNGTYYVNTGPSAEIFELYDGFEGTVIDGQTWTAPSNPFNITYSRGVDLESIAIGDDSCVVYSGMSGKLYHSTDLITWTAYSIGGPYDVNDIYFNTRISITNITNQLTNGDYSITLNSDGTTSVPGTIYPIYDQSIDIGTKDNQFDAIHVHNIKSKTHVNISAGLGASYWFNIYGDITIDDGNFTGVSVDYDTDGNMYVIGSHYNDGNYDTLALKYSPDGNLVWRKAWVNNNNEPCGSANQKFFVKNDTIYWVASSGAGFTGNIYVGTMDLDGVITSSATKIEGGIEVNDMAVDSSDNVVIVGEKSDGSNSYPFAAKVNTSTNTVVWSTWIQDYIGWFRSVALDNSNNLYVVGTMNVGGDDYAVLSRIYNDGETDVTVQVDDNNIGYGSAVAIYASSVYVYHSKNSGGGIISSFDINIITQCNWSVLLANGEEGYQPNDIITDGNGYIYAVATINLGGNEDFHVIRLNDGGDIQWQRNFGSNQDEGIGYGIEYSNGSRMAAVLNNDRLAITGYTLQNPLDGTTTYDNAKSIAIQMPTDGTCQGVYGSFQIGNYGVTNTTITSSVNLLDPFSDVSTLLPEYSDNNGFVPNTVLAKPENFAVKVEIRGPSTDGASWQFDTEGGITLPSGGSITTNDYNGSVYIRAGNKSEIGNGTGNLDLEDGSENSLLSLQSTNARLSYQDYINNSAVIASNYSLKLEHDDLNWHFRGDQGSYIGSVREPYGHYSIVRAVVRVNSNATNKVIWISRNNLVTSGKFTVNIDTGANDSNFDSMTCEIVLAAKRVSNLNSVAKVSVYGLVYTSDDPLVTFDTTIIPGGTYTVTDGDLGVGTSGSGSGATITIVANANGSYYSKGSISNAGTGYKVNDTITIAGNLLGGITEFTDSNYAKIVITTVNGSGGITDYNFAEDSGYTNAGKVAITCTPAAGLSDYLYVKIRGTESESAIYDYYC